MPAANRSRYPGATPVVVKKDGTSIRYRGLEDQKMKATRAEYAAT